MARGIALRRAHKRRYHVASRLESAAETIGPLNVGDEVTGLKTEQFDISVCDETYEFYRRWADELWAAAAPEVGAESVFKSVFDRFTQLRGSPEPSAWPSAREVASRLPTARDIARRIGAA